MAAAQDAGGQNRVAQAIQKRIENGKFYEAQQMFRTQAFRYSAQEKYGQARTMLSDGTCTMLENKEWQLGTDLALCCLDIFDAEKAPAGAEEVGAHLLLSPAAPPPSLLLGTPTGLL